MLSRCEPAESRGLVEEPLRRCTVEDDDTGDAACEARVSTWSMVCDCHPWLTLTIAYDKRARNSAES